MNRHAFDLGMLFLSKSGAVLVGVLFLPWYRELLGESAFGIVAIILSMQALLIMLDLGMATLLARDVASRETSLGKISVVMQFRQSEVAITLFYLLLLLFVLFWYYLFSHQVLSAYDIVGIIALFFTLVLQNVSLSALVALKLYVLASVIQIVGVISRALVTVLALVYIEASLTVFVFSQLSVSLIYWMVTRYFCNSYLLKVSQHVSQKVRAFDVWALVKRGSPLLFAGIAGASVMYLDKPIILHFISASVVGQYFLAMSFAMLPLFVLAAPVAQFFQPKIVEALSKKDVHQSKRLLQLLFVSLIFFVAVPTFFIWMFRDDILQLWLQDEILVGIISDYVGILLLAALAGSFGYIPYIVLVAIQDFKFQMYVSLVLSVLTIIGVATFASMQSVYAISVVYLAYYLLATIVWGLRSWIKVNKNYFT